MEYNQKQLSIIEAAEKLFASQGFHGTSVRDIAHEADMNIAMISYYFGSKEKLIEAIFLKRIFTWKMMLEGILNDPSRSFEERLERLVETYVGRVMRNPCFQLIMMRAQIQTDFGLQELIFENKKEVYELIRGFIREGQEKGFFNGDVDIIMMVNTLIGTTNHVMSTRHHLQKLMDLQHLTDEALQEYLITHITNHLKKLFKAIIIHEA